MIYFVPSWFNYWLGSERIHDRSLRDQERCSKVTIRYLSDVIKNFTSREKELSFLFQLIRLSTLFFLFATSFVTSALISLTSLLQKHYLKLQIVRVCEPCRIRYNFGKYFPNTKHTTRKIIFIPCVEFYIDVSWVSLILLSPF